MVDWSSCANVAAPTGVEFDVIEGEDVLDGGNATVVVAAAVDIAVVIVAVGVVVIADEDAAYADVRCEFTCRA